MVNEDIQLAHKSVDRLVYFDSKANKLLLPFSSKKETTCKGVI